MDTHARTHAHTHTHTRTGARADAHPRVHRRRALAPPPRCRRRRRRRRGFARAAGRRRHDRVGGGGGGGGAGGVRRRRRVPAAGAAVREICARYEPDMGQIYARFASDCAKYARRRAQEALEGCARLCALGGAARTGAPRSPLSQPARARGSRRRRNSVVCGLCAECLRTLPTATPRRALQRAADSGFHVGGSQRVYTSGVHSVRVGCKQTLSRLRTRVCGRGAADRAGRRRSCPMTARRGATPPSSGFGPGWRSRHVTGPPVCRLGA
jgi:hypothetical protein